MLGKSNQDNYRAMILQGSFGVFDMWLETQGGIDEIQRITVDRTMLLENTTDAKVVDFLRREISNLRKIEEIAIWSKTCVVNDFKDGEMYLQMLCSILPLLQP